MADHNGFSDKSSLSEELARRAVQFVINTHAATVNMRLYPPKSSMVVDTLEQAKERLDEILDEVELLSVTSLEGRLLINGVQLEELEQQRAPIKSFVEWMNERGISTVEFRRGVTIDELRAALEVVGEMMVNPEIREDVDGALARRSVKNVSINRRVYVAIEPGMEISAAGLEGRRKASPLDALKDELLAQYLMGRIEVTQIDEQELGEALLDTDKVGNILSSFISQGSEQGILARSKLAEEGLARLASIAEGGGGEPIRDLLTNQIARIVASMTPAEMSSVLSSGEISGVDVSRMRKNVIEMLSDRQLLDLVDSLIADYLEMRKDMSAFDKSWVKEKLMGMNSILLEAKSGEREESISELIDRKLDEAQIVEERDLSTGKRVFSAYQLLGGPLEEEDVPDLGFEDDEVVSLQIKRLYEMEEDDLSSGMLLRLVDSIKADSEKVRRYATHLIRETISQLHPEHALQAASIVFPALRSAVVQECDYQTFVHEADTLGLIAGIYIKAEKVEEVVELIETMALVSSPDGAKGREFRKHANDVLQSLIGPGGPLDPALFLAKERRERVSFAVDVLSRLGTEFLSPLVEIVKNLSTIERHDAIFEAIVAAGSAGLEALVSEMKKPNPWYVSRNILRVLGELRSKEAIDHVYEMAGHPDERVRREVIRSLAKIGARECLEFVMGALNDPSPAVRRTAVRMLGSFHDTSVAPLLIDIIEKSGKKSKPGEEGLSEAACLAIGDLGDPAYTPYLVEVLGKGGLLKKGKPPEVRAAAALALGMIGCPENIPALRRALEDPSAVVRSSAERALGLISSKGETQAKPGREGA